MPRFYEDFERSYETSVLPFFVPVLSNKIFLLMLMVMADIAIGFMVNAWVRLEK